MHTAAHHANAGHPLARAKQLATEFSQDIDRRIQRHLDRRKELERTAEPHARRALAVELEAERVKLLEEQRAVRRMSERVKQALQQAIDF